MSDQRKTREALRAGSFRYFAQADAAIGRQETQWIRHAQHPLAHMLFGNDSIQQQRCSLSHAQYAATEAEARYLQLNTTKTPLRSDAFVQCRGGNRVSGGIIC